MPVASGRGSIVLKDENDDANDSLSWEWVTGSATTEAEFGDPVNTTTYELCIYDGAGRRLRATAPAGGFCGTTSCWEQTVTGFKYVDDELTPSGLRSITLRAGGNGRARIIVQGRGVDLDMPTLANLSSPLIVQLHRSGSPICWGASYSFPPAMRNDAEVFKDTAD